MESKDKIPGDFESLEKYAPTLHRLGKTNPFSVPQGYFEKLHEMLGTVVALDKSNLSKINNNIPAGYFDALPAFIQAQATLSDIKKQNPFEVPADYFDYLPARVQERIQQTARQESWLSKLVEKLFSPRLAFAFSIILVVVIAGVYLLQYPAEITNNNLQLSDLNKKELTETANEFDEDYLIDELSEGDGSTNESITSESDNNITDYLIDNDVEVNTLLNEM